MIYRVGIIGCGSIFPMHAYPVRDMKDCVLAAVCDNKKDRADEKAAAFGCKAYYDYKEMIYKEKFDVVHICTPHYLHPPMAIYALDAASNVLTEKPMSTTFEDTVAMVNAAERSGKTLGVIFQNRYNPGSVFAKQKLASGELGAVLGAKMSVTWMRTDDYYSKSDWKGTWDKEGGGVMIDQAIHTFDLLRWLVASEVEYVDCRFDNRTHTLIDVEDVAEGIIKFKSGVTASFYAINYYSRDADVEIELHCEKGMVNIAADTCVITMNNGQRHTAGPIPGESFDYGDVKGYWGISHVKQINDFYDNVRKGRRPAIDGREAMETMRMVLGLYDSGKKGGRIVFDP